MFVQWIFIYMWTWLVSQKVIFGHSLQNFMCMIYSIVKLMSKVVAYWWTFLFGLVVAFSGNESCSMLSNEPGVLSSLLIFILMIEQIKHWSSCLMDLYSKIFSSCCLNPKNIQSTDEGTRALRSLVVWDIKFWFHCFSLFEPNDRYFFWCWSSKCFLLQCGTDKLSL